jgi:ubiquitin carboxyl-terminal hydrolase 7
MAEFLPLLPDLDTAEQTYQTQHIQNWKELPHKVHWPIFECGGSPWCVFKIIPRLDCHQTLNLLRQILFYPSGNRVDSVSLYLKCGYEDGQEPENWHACVQFALVLWSPSQPSKFVSCGREFSPSLIGLFWLIHL